MSLVQLALPETIHRGVRRMARRQGIAPAQLIVQTLSRMVEADQVWKEMKSRASKRSKKDALEHFRRILANVPDVPPMPGDELPAGFKLPGKARGKRGRNGK